ncbi:hypothetical protein M404DRAFT_10275 [Pisolithus tinctorius Marx 270]|uniref:Defective in cullin neddylation protein n=1 Tax=Pisolithus tinctorius Marx 270 TaxID=870435 RepID=A0A0C3NGB8_PISTI|nr:hypothetical protein M404DRAFT_10275 [Pisolithus tinctorius Marx 270]
MDPLYSQKQACVSEGWGIGVCPTRPIWIRYRAGMFFHNPILPAIVRRAPHILEIGKIAAATFWKKKGALVFVLEKVLWLRPMRADPYDRVPHITQLGHDGTRCRNESSGDSVAKIVIDKSWQTYWIEWKVDFAGVIMVCLSSGFISFLLPTRPVSRKLAEKWSVAVGIYPDRLTVIALSEFLSVTGASTKEARRYLEKYKLLDAALDAYFTDGGRRRSETNLSTSSINGLFDKYKDPGSDEIGVDGTVRLCGDLGVDQEDIVLLAIAYELKSPHMGEWTRKGWISGLKSLG